MKFIILAYQLIVVFSMIPYIYASDETYYSQYKQDSFIYNTFFKDKKNGTFVEIGANNGILISNTYFFEKYLGWSGICIEPIPDRFEELQKNRNCICINGCITDVSGWKEFLLLTGPNHIQMLSGLVEKYDSQHVERIENELKENGGSKKVVRVECFRLMDLLKHFAIKHIDYISIDTEGGELSILKSIDYDSVEISIIGVENNYDSSDINDFLISKGYIFVTRLGCDEIYKRNSIG